MRAEPAGVIGNSGLMSTKLWGTRTGSSCLFVNSTLLTKVWFFAFFKWLNQAGIFRTRCFKHRVIFFKAIRSFLDISLRAELIPTTITEGNKKFMPSINFFSLSLDVFGAIKILMVDQKCSNCRPHFFFNFGLN